MSDGFVIDTPDGISFFQLVARRGALRMELRGMKRRGRSAYSICKSEYGLRGSRESVLAQLDTIIDDIQGRRSPQPDCTGAPEPKEAQA